MESSPFCMSCFLKSKTLSLSTPGSDFESQPMKNTYFAERILLGLKSEKVTAFERIVPRENSDAAIESKSEKASVSIFTEPCSPAIVF